MFWEIIRFLNMDRFGVQISVFISIPGKNEKFGKFYNRESGFTIYPNGKIKNNTLIAKRWGE